MIISQKFECEICGKEFDTSHAVRDEISIMNGADTRAYAYVCSRCVKSVVEVLDREFPRSKYAVRIRERQEVEARK